MTDQPSAAPDVVEVEPHSRPARGRRLWGAAVLVLAVTAAGSGATWLAMGGGGTAADPSSGVCPDTMPNASPGDAGADPVQPSRLVPATPTVEGLADRLVPAEAPSSVVLCEYHLPQLGILWSGAATYGGSDVPYGSGVPPEPVDPATPVTDLPLGRAALHAGTDAAVAPVLAMLQQATIPAGGFYTCVSWGRSVVLPQYLVRLTYDDGVVWVASPVNCTTTNGDGLARVDVSQPVFDALNHPDGTTPATPATPIAPTSAGPATPPPADELPTQLRATD